MLKHGMEQEAGTSTLVNVALVHISPLIKRDVNWSCFSNQLQSINLLLRRIEHLDARLPQAQVHRRGFSSDHGGYRPYPADHGNEVELVREMRVEVETMQSIVIHDHLGEHEQRD
mmetsp:Transcript_30638/g.76495  ORF Transcript_30638/g.76495 Transcript_30638/m.76495 type:complete len:115 (+) Transcript_30638:316-660(+)